MNTIEIILLVALITFVIVAICLCMLICRTAKMVRKVNQLLVPQADEMGANINHKLKCLDPFFRALENYGCELECKSALRNEMLTCKYCKARMEADEFEMKDLLELAMLGINVWKKFKKG